MGVSRSKMMLNKISKSPFTKLMISIVPKKSGVYYLWDKEKNIIYIGYADGSGGLYHELELHLIHKHPVNIEGIYDFYIEVCLNPAERHAVLLGEFEQKFGKLPKYNQ